MIVIGRRDLWLGKERRWREKRFLRRRGWLRRLDLFVKVEGLVGDGDLVVILGVYGGMV